jgi:hypothetical protein
MRNPEQLVALIAAAGFVIIATFQAALALGAPFGEAAWGGRHVRLPGGLRAASAVAVGVWLLAAVVILARAGLEIVALPADVTTWGAWILVALLGVGAVVNFASSSRWERFGWGPLALFLAALSLWIARQ